MTFHLSTTTLGGVAAGDGGQRPPTLPKPRTPYTRHVHALCMRGAPRSSKET